MTRPIITLAVLITLCANTQAEIYRWTDQDRNTHFSDNRPEHLPDLEKVELHINTAIPADKPVPKPQAGNGPEIIIIGNGNKPRSPCNTRSNGILENNQAWDTRTEYGKVALECVEKRAGLSTKRNQKLNEMRATRDERPAIKPARNKAPDNLYLHIAGGIFLGFGALSIASLLVWGLLFGAIAHLTLR